MNKIEHKYLLAEKKIREAIRHFEIDAKLPGERVFAKKFGISYMTVRKAVENLVTQGVLYKVPKKGAYVADPKETKRVTRNIGYFLDSSIKDGLSSPYYSLVFDALEKEATKHGYALMYCSDFDESLTKMEKIDGAIISCFPRIENIVQHVSTLVPVVCIDNRSADKFIPSVSIDNFNAVAEAINHLCTLGHKRIGFVTGLDDSDVGIDRLAGYKSTLKSHGIKEDTDLIFKGDYSFETGVIAADYFLTLDRQPTAIMCANDLMAVGAIKESSRRGFKVPEDISVIGFDDINIATQLTPALTTIAAPVKEIAEYAVRILSSAINPVDLDNSHITHITLPAKLVLRDTVAANTDSTIAARKQKAN